MAPERHDKDELRRRFAEEARAERPDLALLCLLLSTEADPALDANGTDAAQIELDRLAGLLPYGLRGGRAWASALAELLGERYGFQGASADYQRLESSLLHEVLRRRRGLPILLSVVWIEVARRAGAPVYGVALPGHFVVGFGDPAERVLADPFAGGRPLTEQDAELLVAGATGEPLEASMLVAGAAAGDRAADPEQHPGVGGGPPGTQRRGAVGGGAVTAPAVAPGQAAFRAGPAAGPGRGVPARGGGDGRVRTGDRGDRPGRRRGGARERTGGAGDAELTVARGGRWPPPRAAVCGTQSGAPPARLTLCSRYSFRLSGLWSVRERRGRRR